jgi:hypothetical protein
MPTLPLLKVSLPPVTQGGGEERIRCRVERRRGLSDERPCAAAARRVRGSALIELGAEIELNGEHAVRHAHIVPGAGAALLVPFIAASNNLNCKS